MDESYLILGAPERVLAIPVGAVVEMVLEPRMALPPEAPPLLAGLMNLRGRMVAVLDLSRLLGGDPARPGAFRPVVVLRHGAARQWAVLVDRVFDVIAGMALAVPADSARDDCVAGMVEWRAMAVPVLEPERLLARREALALEAFARRAAERAEGFRLASD